MMMNAVLEYKVLYMFHQLSRWQSFNTMTRRKCSHEVRKVFQFVLAMQLGSMLQQWGLEKNCSLTSSNAYAGVDAHGSVSDALGLFMERSTTPSVHYNFTAAICAIVKDDEAHLEEWIDYHLRVMDFQNIYLYDNSDNHDLQRWYLNTRNHPIYSRVEVTSFPGVKLQANATMDCVQRFGTDPNGPQHDYFAMIDDDEFIVSQTPLYTNIRGILQDYLVPYGGSLIMNWMLFGTSNHTTYAPLPVLKRFQYRERQPEPHIKSIVATADFKHPRNPHAVVFHNKTRQVRTTKFPGATQSDKTSPQRALDEERPSDILLLYHYRFTSEKEYLHKRCVRGNLGNKWCSWDGKIKDSAPGHVQIRSGDVFDDKAWKALTQKVPKYRFYDTVEDFS